MKKGSNKASTQNFSEHHETANSHSGFSFGGGSPFNMKGCVSFPDAGKGVEKEAEMHACRGFGSRFTISMALLCSKTHCGCQDAKTKKKRSWCQYSLLRV